MYVSMHYVLYRIYVFFSSIVLYEAEWEVKIVLITNLLYQLMEQGKKEKRTEKRKKFLGVRYRKRCQITIEFSNHPFLLFPSQRLLWTRKPVVEKKRRKMYGVG